MTDKVTLSDLASLENQTTAIATINANNDALTTAINDTLSRSGVSPNQMESNLDMNSNRIINLPAPVDDNDAARIIDVGNVTVYAAEAAASAAAASNSASTAAASATTAGSSATTATASASAASTSATNASTSASNAATSATTASTAATNAANSNGFQYVWSTDTTSSDPTSGKVKVNNATIGSATALYISETDANSNGVSALIATLDDSTNTNKALVKILKNPTNWVEYFVTSSVTDNGTWDSMTISAVTNAGSFSNGDSVIFSFSLIGNKGADGAGTGDVLGPASNTDTNIPQWNGANSKTLKDGLPVSTLGAALINASSKTAHGVLIGNGTSQPAVTATGSSAQIFISQGSSADPTWNTVSSDATISSSGAVTLANGSSTRTNLGLAIGTNVQAFDAQLSSTLPQNSKSAAYTTVLTDGEKHILHPSADTTARVFTIDSNANVAYPIGTTLTFVNQNSAGVVTISITSDTMRLAGAGTTGSRTLAANGIATALKITSTEWIISGTGLT